MNRKSLAVHAAIALVSLAAAYALSRRSDARALDAEGTLVVDLRLEEIKELKFSNGPVAVSLRPKTDEHKGSYAWVSVSPSGSPAISFRGSRFASHVLEGYAPLRAIRDLGILGQAQLKEGGLEQTSESISISGPKGERKLTVGTPTVAGDGRRVLDSSNRHVYIVPTDLIPKPEKAMSEMFDSNLHGFPMDETTRMVIEYEGKRREAIVGGRKDPPVFWSWKDDAEHPSQELTSWVEHVDRLSARTPAIDSTNLGEPKVKVTYFHRDQERGFLNLWDCVREDRKVHCLASTERTVGVVDVGAAGEQVENDASRILSSVGDRVARPGTVMQ